MPKQTTTNQEVNDMIQSGALKAQKRASEIRERAAEAVDSASTKAGEQITGVGESVREAGETTALALENAGTYLQEASSADFIADVGDIMRRHPKATLGVGLALGFVLARAVSR